MFVAPAVVLGAANGLSMPSAQAGAIGTVLHLAGTASGLSGFLGTIIGAAATQAVAMLQHRTPLSIAVTMALCAAAALVAALVAAGGEPDDERVTRVPDTADI